MLFKLKTQNGKGSLVILRKNEKNIKLPMRLVCLTSYCVLLWSEQQQLRNCLSQSYLPTFLSFDKIMRNSVFCCFVLFSLDFILLFLYTVV